MTALYCVGCGRLVAHASEGETLAISCRCGALAPILVNESGQDMAPPASLVYQLLKPPHHVNQHIEYYLGYSDHESDLKDDLIGVLQHAGSKWQEDCEEEECREVYTRCKARWERLARIEQIGEE